MMLTCRCGVKNYLDPYPFWNFAGRTRCAGCGTIYALEISGGAPNHFDMWLTDAAQNTTPGPAGR